MANKKERRRWGEGDSTISKIERVIRPIFLFLGIICLAESLWVPYAFLNWGIILLWIGIILMRQKDVGTKEAYASFFKYLTMLWGIAILMVIIFDFDIWKIEWMKAKILGASDEYLKLHPPEPPIESIMLFGNPNIPLFFFNLIMFLVLRKRRTRLTKEEYQKMKEEWGQKETKPKG